MDYDEFCNLLGELDYPDKEQKKYFFDHEESVHLRLHIGKRDRNDNFFPTQPLPDRAKWMCDLIPILEARGAVRGIDFIVMCGENVFGDVYTEIHMVGKWMSDEDV